MDRYPSLREVWSGLPSLLRAGLVSSGMDSPEVFRNAWDGSVGEAGEIAEACGGQEGAVEGLVALWGLCERPAASVVNRLANFQACEATAAVEMYWKL